MDTATRIYCVPDDFEAVIRIFPAAEGGRATAPFNGIRWDFAYEGERPEDSLYMIWPDFHDEVGDSFPIDKPLPVGVELAARMHVLSDEMRCKVHRQRMREGLRFYCHEGSKRVAEGRVVRLTGLFSERAGGEHAA